MNYSFRLATGIAVDVLVAGEGPGKYLDLEGAYTRAAVYSDIAYLDPGSLETGDVARIATTRTS